MKSKKKFVLAGLVLLAITGLLALAGCKNDTVPETPKYTVKFETERGAAPNSITVDSGTKLTDNDLKIESVVGDYIFEYWYDKDDATKKVAAGYTVTKDVTLVAKWIPIKIGSEVAVVVDSSGTILKRESTLEAAVSTALQNIGSFIYLVADAVGCTIQGTGAESLTLDLNGRKVEGFPPTPTSKFRYGLNIVDCKVIIRDSSPDKTGVISVSMTQEGLKPFGITCRGNSSVVVDGINIEVTSYDSWPSGIKTMESGECRILNSNIKVSLGGSAFAPFAFYIETSSNDIILDGSVTTEYSSVDGTDCCILESAKGCFVIAAGFKKPQSPLKVQVGSYSTKQETEMVFAKPESPEVSLDPSWFTSAVAGYHVEKDGDGNLIMVKDN